MSPDRSVALKRSPAERVHEGWRADVGIPELALVIRNVRHTRSPRRVAEDLVEMCWPEDQAKEFALIISRLSEIVLTRRTADA